MPSVQMDQALADKMLERAISFCSERKFGGNSEQVLLALRQGRCDICSQLTYSLIRQISEYLGQLDRTVKAVYAFEAENLKTGDSATFRQKTGVNLVAWVDRKSAAFSALGATLETVLSKSRRKLSCPNATPACFTLDIQMVDDKDVQERRGYGLLVTQVYIRSVQAWARIDELAQTGYEAFGEHHSTRDLYQSFSTDLAPEESLIEQALLIENLSPAARTSFEHRLRELKVALIRRIISDQLAYINIAKEWFSIADLAEIRRNKIGTGKIGGKSAGLLLAGRILNQVAGEPVRDCIHIPKSYFLGSDLIYVFMTMNGLMHWNDQKYKPEDQIRDEFPQILEEFQAGNFPPEILDKLQSVLDEIGPQPLIVRSSSQLEDNFGTSFAGKYASYFCPNGGTPRQNQRALANAIARTYASTLNPEALLYRRSKGLQDYDERMAILIQPVQGEKFGRYYLPHGAGVAFSRNLYRWSPQIRREDGFVRLVWGLGTRAVERLGNDFPRLVALSHPLLQPDDSCEAIRRYSQQYVDLIDLEENSFKTLPVHQVISSGYPPLRYLAQLEQDGYFVTPRSRIPESEIKHLAITFQELLRRTPCAALILKILRTLEEHYHAAVDLEFTLQVRNPNALHPDVQISLLQCRPQSHIQPSNLVHLPKDLSLDDVIFSTHFMVPRGYVPDIRYVLFVEPEAYFALPTAAARSELGRIIGRLNANLGGKTFICVGPGRWGTRNSDLGVYVSYSDIYNSSALVELAGRGIGPAPEPSLGTHFFQDLMEAQIYPLAICFDKDDIDFNRDFFYNTPTCLPDWLPEAGGLSACLRLIEVASFRAGHHLELVMDDDKGEAVAYLASDPAHS